MGPDRHTTRRAAGFGGLPGALAAALALCLALGWAQPAQAQGAVRSVHDD